MHRVSTRRWKQMEGRKEVERHTELIRGEAEGEKTKAGFKRREGRREQ